MPEGPPAPCRLTTLDAIHAAIWEELGRALVDRRHAFRTPVLATLARRGAHADARTVVLREVVAPRLSIYTDARSPKVAQIDAGPSGTLVFWSPELRWQVRATVTVAVVRGGERVGRVWEAIRATAQAADYLAGRPPGAVLGGPDETALGAAPQLAILDARVTTIDWLELGREEHRRALWSEGKGRWVQP